MENEAAANRWWESYLVRYLMPSIAGVAIVWWLACPTGGMSATLRIPGLSGGLGWPSLALVLLYGNLFCYVASLPILVFHATRSADVTAANEEHRRRANYHLASLALLALSAALARWAAGTSAGCYLAFGAALAFGAFQAKRLHAVVAPLGRLGVLRSEPQSGVALQEATRAYAYAYSLSRRRGIPNQKERPPQGAAPRRKTKWRKDLVETYRHMREHGNAAFILVLEVALAGLTMCAVSKPGLSGRQQIAVAGVLFALWAAPSLGVHWLAEAIEARFSRFADRGFGAGLGATARTAGKGTPRD